MGKAARKAARQRRAEEQRLSFQAQRTNATSTLDEDVERIQRVFSTDIDAEEPIDDEEEELTRNLSHYLGRGATQRYPNAELYLSSVPGWQSRHQADPNMRDKIISVNLRREDGETCHDVRGGQNVFDWVAATFRIPSKPVGIS